jgi:hypothetical protein
MICSYGEGSMPRGRDALTARFTRAWSANADAPTLRLVRGQIFRLIFVPLHLSAAMGIYVVIRNRLTVSIHIWVVDHGTCADVRYVVERRSAK